MHVITNEKLLDQIGGGEEELTGGMDGDMSAADSVSMGLDYISQDTAPTYTIVSKIDIPSPVQNPFSGQQMCQTGSTPTNVKVEVTGGTSTATFTYSTQAGVNVSTGGTASTYKMTYDCTP
ncbi:hypothetical protein [Undibacterium sp. TJN19]|uniref:hypothetical protein n=1 Tax=Undibacterium sp. TJN19 TaxID=3413055 RepID=UPI003BF479F7